MQLNETKTAKHAYLVMAHNNWGVLKKQLELLDDERNDFFIHIDKNANGFDEKYILENVRSSKVYFIERKRVYWADYTQTQVELDLLRAAVSNSVQYSYLHLVSGSDLPIKSKNDIFDYFENDDRIYLCLMTALWDYQMNRTKYYYPFINTRYYRKYKLVKGMSLILGRIQGLLGINRHKKKGNYAKCYCGWNWFSIPLDFAKHVLENEKKIYSTFHHTLASDESFMQTVAKNSDYMDRVYKPDVHEESVMRLIDWKRGSPYTFRKTDFDEIMSSPYLFVRKIDENVDAEIADMIYQSVHKLNKK